MLKTYNQLSNDLKQEARELHPLDYTEWYYRTQGVEIAYSCR